ncbi:alpha-hydroxy acid oxidase [Dokdonella soli]|uniref:Alpha-hydroxy acid oxidase n=1 Tax=Dokdonella soli TaxID=529810 RepID=A0ABN1IVE8_9GAMM
MKTFRPERTQRRRILRAFAALPIAGLPLTTLLGALARAHAEPAAVSDAALTAAAQILNVMDFEPLAKATLPPAHFAYLATGADDDQTVRLNHEAFSHYQIRSRRLIDVSHADLSTQVFGQPWTCPIYLSAVGSMRAFHPDGELAVARAAGAKSALMMLSTVATTSIEDAIAARGTPVWQQLYTTDDWSITQAIVRRAERAGSSAIVLTVDNLTGRNNETLERAKRVDTRDCAQCHVSDFAGYTRRKPMLAGLDLSHATELSPLNMSWDFFARLRGVVSGKLIIKGIVTAEDAALAVRHGADGIVVSNHGGRDEETLRPSIDCLPEVVAAVKRRVPVFVDGGIRRGTDVFKALALGATGVGIGRPYVWGLAAFGQSGVEAVIDLLTRELRQIMRQAGTPTIAAITPEHVIHG